MESHESIDERTLSRRALLKRMAAGTAIAWSAPVLSSLGSRAFAQVGSPRCTTCQDVACLDGTQIDCAASCICARTAEGACTCIDVDEPGCADPNKAPCADSTTCPANYVCIDTCGGCQGSLRICWPLCGEAQANAGPSTGGVLPG